MRSKKITISPGMLLVLVVVFMLGLASAATAGSLINGKKIKKGSIPYSALSKDAQKKLKGKTGSAGAQGPQGPAGAGVTKYWAIVSEGGSVVRSSGGISSTYNTNGGTNAQYRVSFPVDVSQCGYWASTADPNAFGQAELVVPTHVGVARSTADSKTLAVTVTNAGGTATFQDNFFVAVIC